jgi:lysophospholipase L1-like esterase
MLARLLAAVGLGLSGCGRADDARPPVAASDDTSDADAAAPRAGALRYLALGDSYTIGESVDTSQRWPVQLAAALRSSGLDVGDPDVIARTGWRTDDLDRAVTAEDPKGPYPLVSLLIGVNNQYQGQPADDAYRKQFTGLLGRAIAFASGEPSRVLVLSIPDWGVTPFGQRSGGAQRIGRQIDAFNAVNRDAAEKAGVRYVDITPVSRERRELVAPDGLHPSGAMYAEWVKLALPQATAALRAPTSRPASPAAK